MPVCRCPSVRQYAQNLRFITMLYPDHMLTVRLLERDDTVGVLRLNAAVVPAVFKLDTVELARLMAISRLHLAAVQPDGTLAGYVLAFSKEQPYDGDEFITLRSLIDGPFVYIDQIVVDERARGMGIGPKLYRELEARATGLGSTVLCCEVNTWPPNPASLAFHRRMGFVRIGEMETPDGRSVTLLSRKADKPAF